MTDKPVIFTMSPAGRDRLAALQAGEAPKVDHEELMLLILSQADSMLMSNAVAMLNAILDHFDDDDAAAIAAIHSGQITFDPIGTLQ